VRQWAYAQQAPDPIDQILVDSFSNAQPFDAAMTAIQEQSSQPKAKSRQGARQPGKQPDALQ
jgi:hypothetical protein